MTKDVRAVDLELLLERLGCFTSDRLESLEWHTGTDLESFPMGWLPYLDSIFNGVNVAESACNDLQKAA